MACPYNSNCDADGNDNNNDDNNSNNNGDNDDNDIDDDYGDNDHDNHNDDCNNNRSNNHNDNDCCIICFTKWKFGNKMYRIYDKNPVLLSSSTLKGTFLLNLKALILKTMNPEIHKLIIPFNGPFCVNLMRQNLRNRTPFQF